MGHSSDYSQATVLLLCIVIVLLYYLYKAKKRKLQEEEQKYIQKFLLPENIQRYSSTSPLKGNGFSPTRFRRVGEFTSPKQTRLPGKTQTKQSPAKKSQTVILDRSSPPSIDKKSLSPASRISGLKADMLQDTKWSPERRIHKVATVPVDSSKENLLKVFAQNTQGTRVADKGSDLSPKEKALGQKTNKILKEFESIKPFDSPSTEKQENSSLRIQPVPATFGPKASPPQSAEAPVVSSFDMQDSKKSPKNGSVAVKKREIAFLEDEDSPHLPKKDIPSSDTENKQYEIITDSSFENDSEIEEIDQLDNLPINKKQLLQKSKIDIGELSQSGASTSLKKYVAKKAVQERMKERPSPKTMYQFFRSAQAASRASATATTAKPTGVTTQGSQGSTQGGGLFGSKPATGTTTTGSSTTTATQGAAQGGGLFGAKPATGTTTAGSSTTPATQGAAQGSGKQNMFATANTNATSAPTQSQNQNQTAGQSTEQPKTSGGLFGSAANKGATQGNAQTTDQAKPAQGTTTSSGGGLFGNLNKTPGSGTDQAQKPQTQTQPQVQTGGLFNKSVTATATPGKIAGQNNAASSSTPLFNPKGSQASRVGDIEDFGEGQTLKKVLMK